MKKCLLVFAASFVASFAFGNDYRALPWPVGPAGDQHLTRTIHNAFGNWHLSWDLIGNPNYLINFHNGIDILPYDGNRDVRAVESGRVSHIFVNTAGEYVVVLVDTLNTTTFSSVDSAGSSHGWSYGHIENPVNHGWGLGDSIPQSALISEMSTVPSFNHMHFSWSPYIYDFTAGSDRNPLDYLNNATSAIDWVWNRDIGGYPAGNDTVMFIPDMNVNSWPETSGELSAIMLDNNSLYGAVDLLYGYCLEGIGQVTSELGVNPVNPQMLKWSLSRYHNYTGGGGLEHDFTKYVANFDGLLGECPAHNDAYKLHYFRLSTFQLAGLLGQQGLVTCLTNCGDSTSWIDLGISNIEENCRRLTSTFPALEHLLSRRMRSIQKVLTR